MKEWMTGIYYKTKDEVGLDPGKHNFQQTVSCAVMARNCEIEKKKNKCFSLQCNLFCN